MGGSSKVFVALPLQGYGFPSILGAKAGFVLVFEETLTVKLVKLWIC